MFVAIVPLLMMIIGAAFYVMASNSKLSELGRILFAAGAFAFGFAYANKLFSV